MRAAQLAPELGTKTAFEALGLNRATFYRRQKPVPAQGATKTRQPHPRALAAVERQAVLAVLHKDRFVDKAPREVYAAMLDEGRYLCSPSTMYRLLHQEGEVKERRDQLRHPTYHRPELPATQPNQVWSWDITKLLGPAKWTYFYLYVIIDIFSRYVVGYLVAHRESATLAERLIRETCDKQGIGPQ